MTLSSNEIALEVQAQARWIPVAQAVVERGAPAFGMPRNQILRTAMAVEEILAHLAKSAPESPVRLTLAPNGGRIDVAFHFKADVDDLWAMNLTAKSELAPTDDNMDHMGLLLAAGVSDSFTIRREKGSVRLVLSQNKPYPETPPSDYGRISARGPLLLAHNPEPGEIVEACALARKLYPAEKQHPDFRFAGRLVDDCAAGKTFLAMVKDEAGAVLGLMCWDRISEKAIRFSGPYVFARDPKPVAEALTEHMINSVARSSVFCITSRLATDELPTDGFELLARIPYRHSDAQPKDQRVWFRLLREDTGAVVRADAGMLPFLKDAYARLALARDIRTVEDAGEGMPERSLFAADLHPDRGEASLRMVLPGRDTAENIRKHKDHLIQSGYRNIHFTIDLASAEQAACGRALLAGGFHPSLLLPFAGQSDHLVFQYVESCA